MQDLLKLRICIHQKPIIYYLNKELFCHSSENCSYNQDFKINDQGKYFCSDEILFFTSFTITLRHDSEAFISMSIHDHFIFFFFLNFIFKLYITVLVLPNIKMNPKPVGHDHFIDVLVVTTKTGQNPNFMYFFCYQIQLLSLFKFFLLLSKSTQVLQPQTPEFSKHTQEIYGLLKYYKVCLILFQGTVL